MSVAELIARLQKLPPHAPVWVQTLIEFEDFSGERSKPDIEHVEVQSVLWEGNHVEIA